MKTTRFVYLLICFIDGYLNLPIWDPYAKVYLAEKYLFTKINTLLLNMKLVDWSYTYEGYPWFERVHHLAKYDWSIVLRKIFLSFKSFYKNESLVFERLFSSLYINWSFLSTSLMRNIFFNKERLSIFRYKTVNT